MQLVYDHVTCKVDERVSFSYFRGHGSFPYANESSKRKGKANSIGRATVLCGKCCVPGAENSTVPQCVPLMGKRERAGDWVEEGALGGDFLFMRALAPKGPS